MAFQSRDTAGFLTLGMTCNGDLRLETFYTLLEDRNL